MSVELAAMIVVGLSCGASMLLTPLAGALGHKFGLVDQPRANELQIEAIPRSGGYALLASFFIAVVASLLLLPRESEELQRIAGLMIGILLIIPLAVIDDFRRLGPLPQLVGQIAVAIIAMAFGLVITNVANPLGGLIILPMFIAIPFTLVWVVGMINTLNFIDTMDGLAAGITAIAGVVLFR